MKTLQRLSDYVLRPVQLGDKSIDLRQQDIEYAKFLQTELNIGMFVPAIFENGVWVMLEKLKAHDYQKDIELGIYHEGNVDEKLYERDLKQYQEAEKNVMFTGWSCYYDDDRDWLTDGKNTVQLYFHEDGKGIDLLDHLCAYTTIEDLTPYKLTLTEHGQSKFE